MKFNMLNASMKQAPGRPAEGGKVPQGHWGGWLSRQEADQSGGQAWRAAQSRSGTTPACSWRMEPTLSRCMIWWELPQ